MRRRRPLRSRSGIAFEGVSHRYGSVRALDGVNLAVGPDETVCLLGPSGCGKSTLLRLAAGLETLQAGRITIGEEVVAASDGRETPPESRGVGLMFQDYALFPHLTVVDNIRYGLPGSRARGEAKAGEALAGLGMSHLADRYPHALSGGQQQRVALLRALAPVPRVMLLDEPFSTLDEHLRHEVRMETMNLLAGTGAASIVVTHDAEEAMLLGDRVVVMRGGRIVQDGTPDEVYFHPADLFTARLFGPVNEYPGVVRGGAVATPLGSIPAPGFGESSRVVGAVRADGVELGDRASGSPDPVWGRVRSVRRLGAWSLVLLSLRDGIREARGAGEGGESISVQVRLAGVSRIASGDRLSICLVPEHTFVFPAPDEPTTGAQARPARSR